MTNEELESKLTAVEGAETLADATESMFEMEQDAREIANRIHALSVKMDAKGLPAISLLSAMIDVCAVGFAFGATGDVALAATEAKLRTIIGN